MTIWIVFASVGGIMNVLNNGLAYILKPYSDHKFKNRILKMLHIELPKVNFWTRFKMLFGHKDSKKEVGKHEDNFTEVKEAFDIIYITKTLNELKAAVDHHK